MPIDAVLPAFLIALVGYLTGGRLELDKPTLSRIGLYILTPALVFNSLATSAVDLASAWKLSLSTLTLPFLLTSVFLGLFRLLKYDGQTQKAALLPTIFTNAGNYGLPVCLFAFGQDGMSLGAVFMVTQSIVIATLGIYIAASNRMGAKTALRQVLKMPTLYASIAGLWVKIAGIHPPASIMRPVELLADCAIGIFLLLLGVQLSGIAKSRGSLWQQVTVSMSLRLIVAPIIAGMLGALFRLNGLPWKILVLQAAMPPPVNSTIIAQEFDLRPDLVSTSTLGGTVASLATLTAWIMWLRAM